MSAIGVAGCTGDGNEGMGSGGDGNATDTPGILIEYSISDPRTHEEVPEEVVEHPNPEDFVWAVVEFEVASGSFDASDIIGLTQLRAGGTEHFTRTVVITTPDEEILTSSNDEYTIGEGTTGKAYYRMSEEPDSPKWIIEQLRNQHGSVEIKQN